MSDHAVSSGPDNLLHVSLQEELLLGLCHIAVLATDYLQMRVSRVGAPSKRRVAEARALSQIFGFGPPSIITNLRATACKTFNPQNLGNIHTRWYKVQGS